MQVGNTNLVLLAEMQVGNINLVLLAEMQVGNTSLVLAEMQMENTNLDTNRALSNVFVC